MLLRLSRPLRNAVHSLRPSPAAAHSGQQHHSTAQHVSCRPFFSWIKKRRRSDGPPPSQSTEPGLVGLPGVFKPPDFVDLAREVVRDSRRLLSSGNEDFGRTAKHAVHTLDAVSNALCKVADAGELVRTLSNDPEWVQSSNEVVNEISGCIAHFNLDTHIYRTLTGLEERGRGEGGVADLTEEERRVFVAMREAMEQQGVHLPEGEREMAIANIKMESELAYDVIAMSRSQQRGLWLSSDALTKAFDATDFDVTKHLGTLQRRHSGGEEQVYVAEDSSVARAIVNYAKDPKLRERVFNLSSQSNQEVESLLVELLSTRQQLAQSRGYQNWNHYSQREGILRQPSQVEGFLSDVLEGLRPGIACELETLSRMKRAVEGGGKGDGLMPADLHYWTNVYKRKHAADTADKMKPYLTLSSLFAGVRHVLSHLFEVDLRPTPAHPRELWHSDVLKFTLHPLNAPQDGSSVPLGTLYVDPWDRPGKNVDSAQFTVRCSKNMGWLREHGISLGGTLQDMGVVDGYQTPCTALALRLSPPAPALSFSAADRMKGTFVSAAEAKNVFHEFGHVTHALLSHTEMQHMSGTRGAVDYVEFPSHLFEHFGSVPDCISAFLRHCRTDETMPQELVLYALIDQGFYHYGKPPFGVSAVQSHLASYLQTFGALTAHPTDAAPAPLLSYLSPPALATFDHLVHYGGSYYCYLYCRVLSSYLWHAGSFAHGDPWARDKGRRLEAIFRSGSVTPTLGSVLTLVDGSAVDTCEFRVSEDAPEKIPLEPYLRDLRQGLPAGD
ncbi:unnamed protein product [Vitrella brassicaformis CCMP3155]|uniref:Peptidase M3A/M3B catalytic domain-containing protein n=3 Tax=Vitrella brassicaformis TaxID=1169539 RepID=A0A0G4H3T8_VITBC|nr:unnamed protein product [Vitrella brassicaformis CCMP3155]|eukprot:CEM38320.1 unnamed protein product [Vitrella brassicaformis CCMP3155]